MKLTKPFIPIPDVQLEVFLRSRRPATIQVRVRGLHLFEGHVLVDDRPVPAPLLYVDFWLEVEVKECGRRGGQRRVG